MTESAFPRALLAAALAHGAIVGIVAIWQTPLAEHAPGPFEREVTLENALSPFEREVAFEQVELELVKRESGAESARLPFAPQGAGEAQDDGAASLDGALARARAARPSPVRRRPIEPAAARTTPPPGGATTRPSAASPDAEASVSRAAEAHTRAPQPASPNRETAPALTPDKLGFGRTNPFFDPSVSAATKKKQAERRLAVNLAQGILDRDRDRSMNAEGPVLSALYSAAMGTAPPRSNARFRAVTDEHGRVRHLELIGANRGFELWSSVAKKALAALSQTTLRAPKGRRLELVLELTSKVQLPSGRSPGAGVNILGIPLKEKRFKDSPEISLLKPILKLGDGRKSSGAPAADLQIGLTLLGVAGDLSDIGATGRQMIHGKLVRQRVL